MYFTTKYFPRFPFFGTPNKPHCVRGLSNRYHMRFDPKLGQGNCAICRVPCVCTKITSMLDKTRTPGVTPHQQPHYQPVK